MFDPSPKKFFEPMKEASVLVGNAPTAGRCCYCYRGSPKREAPVLVGNAPTAGGAAVTTEASGGQRLRPLHQRGGGRGRGAGAGGGGHFTSRVLEICECRQQCD